jgi:hypothetical protein
MIRDPKEKFIAGPHKAAFDKLAQEPAFEEAIMASLLQLQKGLPQIEYSPNQAADAHNQMVGAQKFVQILCSIHQPEPKTKPIQFQELNPDAGV